jgi:hypothetical protein
MRPYAPRDELGYRVPREGTLSRFIYNLHKQGVVPKVIALRLEQDPKKVNVLIHRFKHPAENNARNSCVYRRIKQVYEDTIANQKREKLTVTGKRRQAMLDFLILRTDGATVWDIMGAVYANDIGGGPEKPNIISVMVMRINEQIAHRGFKVRATGGPGSVYRLVRV